MAKRVTHITVFLASPGDVEKERGIAFDIIHEWNDLHADRREALLQIKTWQACAYPEIGERPQALINSQVLDGCDIVVGIFWARFGTPTGEADSGTEEEIRRSVKFQKPVMLYFSDVPLPPSKQDPTQYQKVMRFRDEFRNTGLIWPYNSLEQFREIFRKHLDRHVQRLLDSVESEPIEPKRDRIEGFININKNDGVAAQKIENLTVKVTRGKSGRSGLIPGTIGADIMRKNYVGYLVRQYNKFLKVGKESYGDIRNVRYSFISSRVIQVFKAPANALPLNRFDDLVIFIQKYIDDSIVGRNNRSKKVRSYDTFEEFSAQQLGKRTRKPRG